MPSWSVQSSVLRFFLDLSDEIILVFQPNNGLPHLHSHLFGLYLK